MLEANFNFHPIGQGCFYTGKIDLLRTPSLKFNFVYDCGTDSKMSYLENEIDKFKKTLIKTNLDLLIISHFDADHVNGVSKMLNKIHCKRIIIPYYEPIERLLLYTTTTNKNDDYVRFLQNPINFLSDPDRFRVDEIIIIGGSDNNSEAVDFRPNIISPDDKMSFEEADKKLGESKIFPFNAVLKETKDNDQLLMEIGKLESPNTNFNKVKILQKPHRIDIGIWEFLFYLKKHDNPLLIKKFTEDVNNLLFSEKLSIPDLFDDENIGELKRIYRSYYGQNLNSTSLVTFHGPLFNARNNQHYINWYNWFWCNEDKNCGTLLTGDIDLNTKRKVDIMLQYFGSYINEVCVFQIPHHGSAQNWYNKHPNGLESFCNYLVNHGVGRIHHPSPDVVDYIKNYCKGTIQFNNEASQFAYGFHVYK